MSNFKERNVENLRKERREEKNMMRSGEMTPGLMLMD
jgi:hypothetical protein